jgi:hypothetical protein
MILISVEDSNVGKMWTSAQEAIGIMRGHSFGWKAFWDTSPE